jgi:hypothetical protein
MRILIFGGTVNNEIEGHEKKEKLTRSMSKKFLKMLVAGKVP